MKPLCEKRTHSYLRWKARHLNTTTTHWMVPPVDAAKGGSAILLADAAKMELAKQSGADCLLRVACRRADLVLPAV